MNEGEPVWMYLGGTTDDVLLGWLREEPDGNWWFFPNPGQPLTCKALYKNAVSVESTALFGLLADIREAVGDPTGKLMQDELVERCRLLRECADYIADKSRPAWKSGGRGVAVAKASKAISWPNTPGQRRP